jgi:hypothetical protein
VHIVAYFFAFLANAILPIVLYVPLYIAVNAHAPVPLVIFGTYFAALITVTAALIPPMAYIAPFITTRTHTAIPLVTE